MQLGGTTLWWAWAFAPPGVVPYLGSDVEVLLPPLLFGCLFIVSGVAMLCGLSPRRMAGWAGLLAVLGTLLVQADFAYTWLTFPSDW